MMEEYECLRLRVVTPSAGVRRGHFEAAERSGGFKPVSTELEMGLDAVARCSRHICTDRVHQANGR